MGVDPQTDLVCEIARSTVSIAGAAVATEKVLAEYRSGSGSGDDDPRSLRAEHEELGRQLAALRDRVADAQEGSEGPRALRAELATLLFFAETLRADADTWRAGLEDRIQERDRQRTAERQERQRLAAQREEFLRRRDALRFAIAQTAARMAQQSRGECRRTVPVFTLGEGLTVCSVSVSCPRRGFRCAQRWLVTLNGAHDDVLVERE